MRKFGEYEVSSIRSFGAFLGEPHFNTWVYFRNDVIAGPFSSNTEAEGLAWAIPEIKYHEKQIKSLEELAQ